MRSTSLEICWTRSDMAHPSCGSSTSVCRIRMSKVPCGSSTRCVVGKSSPFTSTSEHTGTLVEAQGEKKLGEPSDLRVQKTLEIFFVHARISRRDVVQLAVLHPLLQPVHQTEQTIEGL